MNLLLLTGAPRHAGMMWLIIVILLIMVYNVIMMLFYKKSDLRKHERYQVEYPVDVFDNGILYRCKLVNISDGGFAFFSNDAIYLPKEDNLIEYRIHFQDDYYNLKGKVVHVDQKKLGWIYSIRITDTESDDYFNFRLLVKDEKRKQPFMLRDSFAYIMTVNLLAKTKRKLSSQRKIARIQVNEICELQDGTVIILDNYNFEYIRVSLVKGTLLEKIVIFPDTNYEIKCTQCPWNPYLYSIDNQKQLARNEEFQKILHGWNEKAFQ